MLLKSLSLFFVFSLCISCQEERGVMPRQTGIAAVDLKDTWRGMGSHLYSFNAAIARANLEDIGLPQLSPYLRYHVSVHRLTYQTTYRGSTVTASGAIAIPVGKSNPSILVFHHGTMFYKNDAPSMLTHNSSWGMELTASNGFLVFIPDYIGYGTTSDIPHPYHIDRPAVDASIDMILAGKEFLKANQIQFNDDGIFIAGFSEGGYDAFAVQRQIETHPEYKIVIKASAPGAGAYDVAYQFTVTTDHDEYPGPGYMALALSAYNDYYLHQPLTNFFLPDYAAKIPNLLSGKYTEEYVHAQLPRRLSGFINPNFLKSYKTDPENIFTDYLRVNTLTNFKVKTPTRFIHGTKDGVVPFVVAQKSYEDLIGEGTSPDILKLMIFDGGHEDIKYQQLMLDWFNTFE